MATVESALIPFSVTGGDGGGREREGGVVKEERRGRDGEEGRYGRRMKEGGREWKVK